MKNVPEYLEELVIDGEGNLTLRGQPIDARPIGPPFKMILNSAAYGSWSPYNTWEKIREAFRRDYLIPDKADAVVFGDAANLLAHDLDLRILVVQCYEIKR